MKTVKETRRDHLRRLIQGYPSQRQFAEALGMAPSQISHIVTGLREVGDQVARRIETELSLREGFLDTPLDDESAPAAPIAHLDQLLSTHELKLLTDYRRMSDHHREILRETAAAYVSIERERGQSPP